jgi:hypothetical protein
VSILREVEDEWGKQMQGELELMDDPALANLVLCMDLYIQHQRRMTNSPDGNGTPIATQIVWALQPVLSPELNGA